jgi:triphosphoribosyl-dephospho-CoA synthase
MSARISPEPKALREAYIEACLVELRALKPGNVHLHAEGHGMTVEDFARSARVSAPLLTMPGVALGERIRGAIAATRAAVGLNTNLGIVLLAAPLLAAAEEAAPRGLRDALSRLLDRLSVADAVAAYDAIRLAAPAGLGHVDDQDAASVPTTDLRHAMGLAAERDSVARQYVTDFAEVFEIGVARLHAGGGGEWAATHVYMEFLATLRDSHIARKHGAGVAERVRLEAARLLRKITAHAGPEPLRADLLEFDRRLKAEGLNPGTSADLTVASLLAFACENILRGK